MDSRKRPRSPSLDELKKVDKRFKTFLSTFKDKHTFTDLTLLCEGRTWYLHRVIVCPQSEFLDRACAGGFLVREIRLTFYVDCHFQPFEQESASRVFTLIGDDPYIVGLMVSYFYSLDYPDHEKGCLSGIEGIAPLSVNALLYGLADKYGAKELKECALSRTAAELSYGENCWYDFSNAVKVVWSSRPPTDKGLRNLYVQNFLVLRKNIGDLENKDFEKLRADLIATPDFLCDVAVAEDHRPLFNAKDSSILKLHKEITCYICTSAKQLKCHGCGSNEVRVEYNIRG